MFGKNRVYKKATNSLGPHVHKQIVDAFDYREEIFTSPEEMAFVAGYLDALVFHTLYDELHGSYLYKDKVVKSMVKHLCNGVMPNRLWDVYQRGEAMTGTWFDRDKPEFATVHDARELGSEAGADDSDLLRKGEVANSLFIYLQENPRQNAGNA